jgi:hypothetical protein
MRPRSLVRAFFIDGRLIALSPRSKEHSHAAAALRESAERIKTLERRLEAAEARWRSETIAKEIALRVSARLPSRRSTPPDDAA